MFMSKTAHQSRHKNTETSLATSALVTDLPADVRNTNMTGRNKKLDVKIPQARPCSVAQWLDVMLKDVSYKENQQTPQNRFNEWHRTARDSCQCWLHPFKITLYCSYNNKHSTLKYILLMTTNTFMRQLLILVLLSISTQFLTLTCQFLNLLASRRTKSWLLFFITSQ